MRVPYLLSAIMLSLFWGTPAAADSYELEYRVQWGNSFLGRTIANWTFTDDSYELSGTAKSEGALSLFYEFEGQNQLQGQIKDGVYLPTAFASQSSYNDDAYDVMVSWRDAEASPLYEVTPAPDLEEVYPLDEASLADVIDPFSAMLQALESLKATGSCNGTYRLFDGRRRSDFTLVDLGTATIEADRPWSYAGDVVICGAANELLGGHRRDGDYDPEEEPDYERVQISVAEVAAGRWMPVRIEVSNFFGNVIVRLNVRDSKI